MKSISHKMILGMVVMTVVALCILWIYQIGFLEKNYMSKQENRLIQLVQSATAYESLTEFEKLADQALYSHNVTLELLDAKGSVVYAVMGKGRMMGNRMLSDGYYDQFIEVQETPVLVQNNRTNTEILVYAKTVDDGSGFVVGAMPKEPLDEALSILKSQMVYIAIVLLALAIAFGLFFSRIFLIPIKKINASVEAISKGQLNTRIDYVSNDELGVLAHRFNHMASELGKTDALRKDLVANVSHELRTPLGLIQGFAEMIRDISGEDEIKRNEHVEVIIEEVGRLKTIVDDVLKLSQLQSGNFKKNETTFSLRELMESVAHKFESVIDKSQLRLTLLFDESDNSAIITADPKLLEQVLHNLVGNAVKNTPAGGEVTISLTKEKDTYVIIVSDTGKGISEQDLPYIWERYYKGEGNGSGTGLGLSIVKQILEMHHYDYRVESQVGQGTRIIITING